MNKGFNSWLKILCPQTENLRGKQSKFQIIDELQTDRVMLASSKATAQIPDDVDSTPAASSTTQPAAGYLLHRTSAL